MSKHIFSIYLEDLFRTLNVFSDYLSDLIQNSVLEIKNKAIHTRVTQVLRLNKLDNKVILFDDNFNIKIELLEQTFKNNKTIYFKILEKNENKKIYPEIILCPSVVKRQALEEIVYSAAAMGATKILPIVAHKSYSKFNFEQERSRLKKIMIAACEQSKNFVLPEICAPISFSNFLTEFDSSNIHKIFFDLDGQVITSLISELDDCKNNKIVLFFGPEGGFTDLEVNLLKENKFNSVSLTTTILRAEHAVALGLGMFRSLFR